METRDYLRILKEEIHSTVFATVDSQGLPVARVIDIMLVDDDSLYFITAKGKEFYRQLMDKKYAAISGVTEGADSLEKKAVSIRGEVENIGAGLLEQVFAENPYMEEIYPTKESRTALEVFCMRKGQGEYFDLSTKPITRKVFYLGEAEKNPAGDYFITERCDGCKSCYLVCPQECIDHTRVPFAIRQENCLHCGNCMEACPCGAVERR